MLSWQSNTALPVTAPVNLGKMNAWTSSCTIRPLLQTIDDGADSDDLKKWNAMSADARTRPNEFPADHE